MRSHSGCQCGRTGGSSAVALEVPVRPHSRSSPVALEVESGRTARCHGMAPTPSRTNKFTILIHHRKRCNAPTVGKSTTACLEVVQRCYGASSMMMAKQCGWPSAKVILAAGRITLSGGCARAPPWPPQCGASHGVKGVRACCRPTATAGDNGGARSAAWRRAGSGQCGARPR